jgi:HAD superfamily hydrolase (TIGR01509 family)
VIRACIFDMDGVLIDTEPVWRRVERDVFARVGVELTDEQLRQTWGKRIAEVVDHWYAVRPWHGVRPKAVEREILRQMVEHVRSEGVVLPGATEAVQTAHAMGLRIAIASSSSHELIDAVVQRLGIADVIAGVCSADDEALGKPDPAVYASAARMVDVPPVDCVAVEDSPAGVRSAKAAGMACIAVRTDPNTTDEQLAGADAVIASLLDLTPELLRNLAPTPVDLSVRRSR